MNFYVYLNVIIPNMLASDLGFGCFSSLFVASILDLKYLKYALGMSLTRGIIDSAKTF